MVVSLYFVNQYKMQHQNIYLKYIITYMYIWPLFYI
jgi:hypothetical protein